jgi:enoyl-CoA hydratase/carnithine racemase
MLAPMTVSEMASPLHLSLGRVTTVTLNRPDKQNAMTADMGDQIASTVERINASPEPRIVVFRGAGRAFSAGGDFDLLEKNARSSPESNERTMRVFYERFLSVLDLRVPSLAVLHGAAVGAGLCFAAACDLRVAANEAKLGVNFVRVGLHPGMGGTILLPRLVGEARAGELMLTGRLIDGQEAERIGLVHRAVPRDRVESAVEELVSAVLAGAPVALAETKRSLQVSLREGLFEGLAREAKSQAVTFATSDLKEAIAAFREGRRPEFTGT